MRVKTGTYTGNGGTQSITGVGFAPIAVFIEKSTNSTTYYCHFMITGMSYGASTAGGAEDANTITALGSDGFSVSNNVHVNENAQTYHYLAFGADATCIKVGSYAGNGSDNHDISGVGFQPDFVWAFRPQNGGYMHHAWFVDLGGDNSLDWSSDIDTLARANFIQAVGADGFQVGTHADVNTNGVTYRYICFKKKTGNIYTSYYDGNASDNRNIVMADAFQPLAVMLKCKTITTGYGRSFAFRPNTLAGDLCFDPYDYWNGSGRLAANLIQALNADGFQVGTDTQVNGSAYSARYFYLAFMDPVQSINFDRAIPISYRTALDVNRAAPLGYRTALDVDRAAPLGYRTVLDVDRVVPAAYRVGVDFDKIIPLGYSPTWLQLALTQRFALEASTEVHHASAAPYGAKARLSIVAPPKVEWRGGSFAVVAKMPVAWLAETTLASVRAAPIEVLAGVKSDGRREALEWTGTLELGMLAGAPIETARGLAKVSVMDLDLGRVLYSAVLPIEWTGAEQLQSVQGLPVEIQGGAGLSSVLRIENLGANQQRAILQLPIETVTGILRTARLPVENIGEEARLLDTWNVLQKASDLFLDTWVVLPVVATVQFLESWNVRSGLGLTFPDIWRVLPQEIITLFGNDIQMPSGKAEKS